MSDNYEATFTWPVGPKEVIITGTFDNWSKSTRLIQSWEGSFSTTLKVPWGSRIHFKYIVDGQWVTSRHEKTDTDAHGNVNNVFQAPQKPERRTSTFSSTPGPTRSEPKPQPVTDPSVKDTIVKTLTSVKESALATEGLHPPSAINYVASGVGAAVATVTGVDPINAAKIYVDEPKPTRTELDLSPVANHGKLPAPLNDIGKLPSLLPAAADGKKAVSTRLVEGLPSLLPVASERTASKTARPKSTKVAPASVPTPTAKVPEPTKMVEETKPTTQAPEPNAAGSTLKEKAVYGADELGRNASSTGSTVRTKKKRESIFNKIKAVFHPEKDKERPKK